MKSLFTILLILFINNLFSQQPVSAKMSDSSYARLIEDRLKSHGKYKNNPEKLIFKSLQQIEPDNKKLPGKENIASVKISTNNSSNNIGPCDVPLVPAFGCASVTTVGAEDVYTVPNCSGEMRNDVFLKYKLGANTGKLNIEIFDNNLSGSMGLILMIFPFGCNENPLLASNNSFYCGPVINNFLFDDLTPGSEVYLMISSTEDGAGEVNNICFTEIDADIPCAANVNCESAEVMQIAQSAEKVCVNGCNDGMPNALFINCSDDFMNPTAWYRFNTGTNNTAVFDLTSDSLQSLRYAILSDCYNLIECNPQTVILSPNSDYWVAVTDAEGNTGAFDLCITLLSIITPCIKDESFEIIGTSMGSPLEGPYFPCEIITFKYSTNFYSGGDCQWLHSFIPYISDCWDTQNPKLIQGPDEAFFTWFPEETIFWKPTTDNPPSAIGINNFGKLCLIGTSGCNAFVGGNGECGSKEGTPMPAGWVSTTPSGSCNSSTDPNQSWGIIQGCDTYAPKTLSFQLTVPCDASINCNTNSEGLVVGMSSFTDGATGGWNNPQCNGNTLLKKKINLNSCTPPNMTIEIDTMCSNVDFIASITSDVPNSTFEWQIRNGSGISGTLSGSGSEVSLNLVNHHNEIKKVEFNINVKGPDGCKSPFRNYEAYIYPKIKSNVPLVDHLCDVDSLELTATATGGAGGPYDYLWSNGSTTNSSTYFIQSDSIITVSISDVNGCLGTDSIIVYHASESNVFLPDYKELDGKKIFNGFEIQEFKVDSFPNATGYFWTIDGNFAGNGKTLIYDFKYFKSGTYELCVHAYNCNPDTLTLCYEITINNGLSTSDCIGADSICNKDLRTFNFSGGFGNYQEIGSQLECDFSSQEYFSHWLTWDIVKAGKLWFTLFPESNENLDFILFKTSGSCDSLESIRCSFANCLGNTGLNPSESDVVEGPGCNHGQNNFLKSLDCKIGEKYYLLVNNYSTQQTSFGIDFCGDALLSCDTIVCNTVSNFEIDFPKHAIKLYPNPNNGNFVIESTIERQIVAEIYNIWGRKIKNITIPSLSVNHLELDGESNGIYFVVYKNGEGKMVGQERIIIN